MSNNLAGAVRRCPKCTHRIGNESYVEALNKNWHEECFRCSKCDKRLSLWYFERNGQLFCKKDFLDMFGESCNGCGQLITGPVMVAGEHRYHPECFQCVNCSVYIGDGDSYALVERSKLFCGKCYKRLRNNEPASPSRDKQHSIQLLDIPATPDRKRGLEYTLDKRLSQYNQAVTESLQLAPLIKITELDHSPELESLCIGDRILEVNGISVKNNSIEMIDKLLRNTCESLQITVEHDPSKLPLMSEPSSPRGLDVQTEDIIYINGVAVRKRLKPHLKNLSPTRRRSKSPSPAPQNRQKSVDLSRASSLRLHSANNRVFRQFRICDLIQLEVLGKGYFGQAIKVVHKDTNEVMVLKEMIKFDEEAQKSFLKEVSVLRSLDHPNVLQFMGVLYKDKKLNIVTEFVPCGTLKELLHDMNRPLSWIQKVKFAKDIAAGMSYLHANDIIHRDLNSQNCFIRKDMSVVVADFGLAKVLPDPFMRHSEKPSPAKTHTKKRFQRKKRYTIVGSAYWMAPEMLNGQKYDEKVDQFSFGIVICEIIGRIYADPDVLPRTIDFALSVDMFYKKYCIEPDFPDAFYKIAVTCCQVDPEKRPSFERVEMQTDSLLLHLEHGAKLALDLQGDPVQYYYALRDGLITPPESPTKSSAIDKKLNEQTACGSSKATLQSSKIEESDSDMSANENDDSICSSRSHDDTHCFTRSNDDTNCSTRSHDANCLSRSHDKNSSVISNSSVVPNSDLSLKTTTEVSMETDKCEEVNDVFNTYPSDTQFQCARLNLFPEKMTDRPKRCAKNFSQNTSAKRYANDFNDLDKKSKDNTQQADTVTDVHCNSAKFSNDSVICDKVSRDIVSTENDNSADSGPIKMLPAIYTTHDVSHISTTEMISEQNIHRTPEIGSDFRHSLTVIDSSDLKKDISMESLNEYFDSFQDLETVDDADSGSNLINNQRCSNYDHVSSTQHNLSNPVTECSPINSSASSSSYFSFSSSPGASLTFSSSTPGNDKTGEKT